VIDALLVPAATLRCEARDALSSEFKQGFLLGNGFREVLKAFIQAPSELHSDAVYSWVHSVALRIISTCLYSDLQPVTDAVTDKSETAAATDAAVSDDDDDETVESVTPRTLVAGALDKLHMVSTTICLSHCDDSSYDLIDCDCAHVHSIMIVCFSMSIVA
jgi:hypothetical protein